MPHILFLFHRDFRLSDHKSLEFIQKELLKTHKDAKIIPLFFFTPEQVSSENKYRSLNSIQFMIQSLMELNAEFRKEGARLYCFYGSNLECIQHIYTLLQGDIQAFVETKDYTPFAKKREGDFRKWCMMNSIEYHNPEDIYLTNPGTITNASGRPFQKFTPFWEAARRKPVEKPVGKASLPWFKRQTAFPKEIHLVGMRKRLIPVENRNIHVRGGRSEGLRLLDSLPKKYDTERDIPSKQTSNLSAHNHFGTVSIREVFWAGRKTKIEEFLRQLYWRDFYGQIMDSFESLYGEEPFAFMKEPSSGWKTDRSTLEKWKQGKTGFPLVDAGMRQLNETGYIHNRARLVCASWLAKDMKIHWRWGEQYFAQKLVDYDVTQNMMNWIWVSSVLPFASAPFRRLDPEVQAKQFDALGIYRATWLGEKKTNITEEVSVNKG
jgi:deoxyribodipyrimidine photo-lyase